MKKPRNAFYLCLVFILLNACQKIDQVIQTQADQSEALTRTFLSLPEDSDPLLVRIISILKERECSRPFIADLVTKAGMPKWEFSELKIPAVGVGAGRISTNFQKNKVNSVSSNSSIDTTVLVPFVFSGKRKVNSFLAIHLNDTIRLDLFQAKNYARYGFDESTTKPVAQGIAKRFMLFEHRLFDIDTFRIKDKRLAKIFSGGRDTTGLFVFEKEDASINAKAKSNYTLSLEICTGGSWVCDPNLVWNVWQSPHCPIVYVGGSCDFQWFDIADDPAYPSGNYDTPISFTSGGGGADDGSAWAAYDPYYGRAPALVYTFNTTVNFVTDDEAQWLYDNKNIATILYNNIYSTQIDESVDAASYFAENVLAARLLFAEEYNNMSGGPYDVNYGTAVLTPVLQLPSVIPIGHYTAKFAALYTTNCALLKLEHPGWGTWKVRWEAMRATVQFGLDVIGMVPGVGTVANLINGTIYGINGEGVNASLSVLASIPIGGWVASGIKFASRGENLMFKATDGLIKFTRDQGTFRKALGLVAGDGWIAHHIISFGLQERPLVQKAAQGGFHINDVLNGIKVTALQQPGSHSQYDARVIGAMQDIINSYGGIDNISPAQASDAITGLISRIKTAIENNPTTKLNDLIF